MKLARLRIRHFRSIEDLSFDFKDISLFCGGNSSGKSNIFKAIMYAFADSHSLDDVNENLMIQKLVKQGPKLSIWIDITFEECPAELFDSLGVTRDTKLRYNFRITRKGKILRKMNGKTVELSELSILKEYFKIVYVPPIRDLSVDGMEPFKQILWEALKKSRGSDSFGKLSDSVNRAISKRAGQLLSEHKSLIQSILKADDLLLDTENLELDKAFSSLSILVQYKNDKIPLQSMGTGHQSTVILHLFRQYGLNSKTNLLYLFEEPDNHLHPTIIRSIGNDLLELSKVSQVFITTHSPILVMHFGLDKIFCLYLNDKRITQKRNILLSSSDKQIRRIFNKYGLRVSEPLFAKRIIVVEGQNDAQLLRSVFEKKNECEPEKRDILIVNAGGKDGVLELCSMLNEMDMDWRAVFDWDAAKSSEDPYITPIEASRVPAINSAIDFVISVLDTSNKRGQNSEKNLKAIKGHVNGGMPPVSYYDDSPIKKLLEKTSAITPSEKLRLITYIENRKMRGYQRLLGKYKIWLWSSQIEGVLLKDNTCLDLVENVIKKRGIIPPSFATLEERKRYIINRIHESAYDIEFHELIVDEYDRNNKFKRSEITSAVNYLFNGVN